MTHKVYHLLTHRLALDKELTEAMEAVAEAQAMLNLARLKARKAKKAYMEASAAWSAALEEELGQINSED